MISLITVNDWYDSSDGIKNHVTAAYILDYS